VNVLIYKKITLSTIYTRRTEYSLNENTSVIIYIVSMNDITK